MSTRHINFTLLGNWKLAEKILKDLPKDVKEGYRQAQRNFGGKLQRTVKRHMRNQDLKWKPLAKSTLKRKGNGIILMESLQYYNEIRVYSSGPYSISVGVRPNIMKLDEKGNTTIDIATYASLHERGHVFNNGRRIPKRPLWVPSWNEMGGKQGMAKEVIDSVNRVLERKLRSETLIVGSTKTYKK